MVNEGLHYDSYYKFVTSAGVALLLVPFIAYGFFCSQLEVVQISEEDFNRLSARSRQLVEQRMGLMELDSQLIAYAFLFSFLLGLAFVVYGVKHWLEIQRVKDEGDKAEAAQKIRQLNQSTYKEILDGAISEVGADAKGPSGESNDVIDPVSTALEIEDVCIARVADLLGDDYFMRKRVWMRTQAQDGKSLFDAIAQSEVDGKQDIVIEVMYVWKVIADVWVERLCMKLDKCAATYMQVNPNFRYLTIVVSDGLSIEGVRKQALGIVVPNIGEARNDVRVIDKGKIDSFEI